MSSASNVSSMSCSFFQLFFLRLVFFRSGGPYHALEVVQYTSRIKKADRITGHQAAEGVASDADLLDFSTFAFDSLEFLFDLVTYSFAAELDAIVSKRSGVSLRYEDVQLVAWILSSQSLRYRGHMVRITP